MLLRKIGTHEVFAFNDRDGQLLIKGGEFDEIDQKTYETEKNLELSTIGANVRIVQDAHIHLEVKGSIFKNFIKRTRIEGIEDFKRAIIKLMELYGDGAVIVIPGKKKPHTGVNYLEETKK